jgi:hypothetical protein
MVKAGRPAAERAALMSASTCPAEVPGVAGGLAEGLGETLDETDVGGLDAAWLDDGGADALGRAAGWVARSGGAACGRVAVLMGPRSAQAPARVEPQASAVCSAVTVPREDGAAAEPAPRLR